MPPKWKQTLHDSWRMTSGAEPGAVKAASPVLNGEDEETGRKALRLVLTQPGFRQQMKAGVGLHWFTGTCLKTKSQRGEVTYMRLVLIRHGESEHECRGIIAGASGCRGLTERGFQQTYALADRLRATGDLQECRALLCSPILRARQTAAVLAGALPVGAVEPD